MNWETWFPNTAKPPGISYAQFRELRRKLIWDKEDFENSLELIDHYTDMLERYPDEIELCRKLTILREREEERVANAWLSRKAD